MTMTQKRFNSLAILNCHKLRTDEIDLIKIANEFVSKPEYDIWQICFVRIINLILYRHHVVVRLMSVDM